MIHNGRIIAAYAGKVPGRGFFLYRQAKAGPAVHGAVRIV